MRRLIGRRTKFILLVFIFLWKVFSLIAIPLIDLNYPWKYFKGQASPNEELGVWQSVGFNDSEWKDGLAPFHYGDGEGGTVLDDMQNNYSTIYLRKKVFLDRSLKTSEFLLQFNYDDGFILWLNGNILLSKNAPDNPEYNSFAPENHESGNIETQTVKMNEPITLSDTCVIAVQVFNVSLTSSDLYFDLSIDVIEQLPLADKVTISDSSGFYDDPFLTEIIPATATDNVKYTLDGSDPRSSKTSIELQAPYTVFINPADTILRAKTPSVILRASAFREGYHPSKPVTRTFIFPDQVKRQGYPGFNWPKGNINDQWIDYEMDIEVVNDARYKYQMDEALIDIPSISLVTDIGHLFDTLTGIYVNAQSRGIDWERPVSVELIHPDGTKGFRVDAGLRIRGGYSRRGENPKHAFRLFFRKEYGPGKLHYPLFGDEGVSEFDKIDLRTSQNYAWSNEGSDLNTMNRDVFCRDLQREMGHPYTRSRYYHLYLNGMYWGLFQSQERGEAEYASSYLGGDPEDYDIIKAAPDMGLSIEATDGNLEAWRMVWNLCRTGFEDNESYYAIQGKDHLGRPDPEKPVLVDFENLIDYMINIFYTGNLDAPVSWFRQNKNPNNFYAVYNRERSYKGFIFLVHDAEHTLLKHRYDEDRVNLADLKGSYTMSVSSFENFHPQWLHYKLSMNPEYRIQFADRVQKAFFNDGPVTIENCRQIFNSRTNEIEMAIIAESARWGDAKRDQPRTKDDDWLEAINYIEKTYFARRASIVLDQLKEAGLYPDVNVPWIFADGSEIKTDSLYTSYTEIKIKNFNNDGGDIVYTLDGSDPRSFGGNVSSTAMKASREAIFDVNCTLRIKARIKQDDEWSALKEVLIVSEENEIENIKFTEISYNPPDTNGFVGRNIEFIELKNTGNSSVNLKGCYINGGIRYTFEEDIFLDPGNFLVLASDCDSFATFYGIVPYDQYKGHLSNQGEAFWLANKDSSYSVYINYLDGSPWPDFADGVGYSLVSKELNPNDDPNYYFYWRNSFKKYGSPMADDLDPVSVPQTYSQQGLSFSIYPNPVHDYFKIYLDSYNRESIRIELMDVNGRVFESVIIDDYMYQTGMVQFNMQEYSLPEGMFFVRIFQGNKAGYKKFVYKKP